VPALIRDVRFKRYPDHTRVVLDLQHRTPFTQRRLTNPDRLVIQLPNTQLGLRAKGRLSTATFPEALAISQSHPRSVTLSLDMTAVSGYKVLPLSRPDRLVIDLYHNASPLEAAPPARKLAAHDTSTIRPLAATPPVTDTRRMEPTVTQPSELPEPPPRTVEPGRRADPRSAHNGIDLIVIDPGHGGKDPGAIGRSGIAEKDIALAVGLRLRDLLVRHLNKRVLMTRDRDVFIELADRAKFANAVGADLFVSIHVNAHPQRSTRGLEIYHFGEASDRRALEVAARENGTPIKDTSIGWEYLVADLLTTKKVQESLELAWATKNALIARLHEDYDVEDHGVKTAPFYVLRFTTMPSILAEIAFITNPIEERLMQSEPFLARVAQGLFDGIKAYVQPIRTVAR
jgi:N-acetylmuramoyl-L-alanine amidase